MMAAGGGSVGGGDGSTANMGGSGESGDGWGGEKGKAGGGDGDCWSAGGGTGAERRISGGGDVTDRGTTPKTSCRYKPAAASPVPLASSRTSPLGPETVTASVPGGSASAWA